MAVVLLCVIILHIFSTQAIWPFNSEVNASRDKSIRPSYNFSLIEASIRNIILVGRSRAGKSTIIAVLKDRNHDPADFKILRGTYQAKINSFTLKSMNQQQQSMHFNIMDTINDTRTNQIISKMILKCVDLEITKINHVYYVMSIQNGLSSEDVQAFKIFAELFVGMEDKISIILSFSQRVGTDDQYQHYINQFEEVPELRPIYEAVAGRKRCICKCDQITRECSITKRKINFTYYNVKNLKIYKENLKLMRNLRQNMTSCCKNDCVDMNSLRGFIHDYGVSSEESDESEQTENVVMKTDIEEECGDRCHIKN